MCNKRNFFIILNLTLLLGFFNWSVLQKEETLAKGRIILLELAPVDPRSLMQGDYMRLNYTISQAPELDSLQSRGYVVVRVGKDGVAQLLRYQERSKPLAEGEQLVKYFKGDWSLNIGAESYFFEEGQGEHFEQAKFGGLKVDAKGNDILIGLYDAQKQLIEPKQERN